MLRVCKALLCAAIACAPISALATGIVPFSGTQQFDKDTSPPAYLIGGQLFIYQAGSSTCAHTFQDFALTVPHPCPIVLPASGRIPAIYAADGLVRLRLLSQTSIQQFDDDNVAIVTAAASSGSGAPIPDATQIFGPRDLKVRFDDQPITGYVRLNGRTIGSATSGASERASADTQSLFTQLWPYANITVVSGKGASAAADWAANKQLQLPDARGRLIGGLDDMGAGAAGRITSATISGPTAIGANGGTETKTLVTGNLPPYTPGGTVTKPSITSTVNGQGPGLIQSAAGGNVTAGGALGGATVTLTVSSSLDATPTFSGAAQGGTSTPLSSMPPVMLFTFYIKL